MKISKVFSVFSVLVVFLGVVLAIPAGAAPEMQGKGPHPKFTNAVAFDVSPALRDMKPLPRENSIKEFEEVRLGRLGGIGEGSEAGRSALLLWRPDDRDRAARQYRQPSEGQDPLLQLQGVPLREQRRGHQSARGHLSPRLGAGQLASADFP